MEENKAPIPIEEPTVDLDDDKLFQWEDITEASSATIATLEQIRAMALTTAYRAEQQIRKLRAAPVVVEGGLVVVRSADDKQ